MARNSPRYRFVTIKQFRSEEDLFSQITYERPAGCSLTIRHKTTRIGGIIRKIMTESEKNSLIKKEFDRINIYFENLPDEQYAVLFPTIQNAAFQKITLDELQELIAETGAIERYQNGEHQSGLKQSAALQSYNNTMKVYQATVKTLYSYLPPRSRTQPAVIPVKTEAEKAAEREERAAADRKREEEIRLACEYQRLQREEGLKEPYSMWRARMMGKDTE